MYVTKFPVHVMEKKRTEREYNIKSRYNKAYGYLDLDRGNNLNFFISLSSKKDSLRIAVAKHYIFDTLLFNLLHRPIPRPRTIDDKLWLHPGARALKTQREFNNMPPDQLHEVFENCIENIDGLVTNLTGKQQKKAKEQFDRLQGQQWKVTALYELWQAENFVKQNTL